MTTREKNKTGRDKGDREKNKAGRERERKKATEKTGSRLRDGQPQELHRQSATVELHWAETNPPYPEGFESKSGSNE